MTPAEIKEAQERTDRLLVILLGTPIIGIVSAFSMALKLRLKPKNTGQKQKNTSIHLVAETGERLLMSLGWIISGVIGWALCLMFSSAFSSLIPYPSTDQTTTSARFLFMAIWVPITFVIWTVVWRIAYSILDRAEDLDKKKKVPPSL